MATTPVTGVRLIEATDIVSHEQINDMFRSLDIAFGGLGSQEGNVNESSRFSATIYASGWTEEGKRWVYTLSNPGITSSNDVEIFLSVEQAGTEPLYDTCTPQNGGVKLYARRRPKTNLDVTVRVREVRT